MSKLSDKVLNNTKILNETGLSIKELKSSSDEEVINAINFLSSQGLMDNNLSINQIIAMNALYRPGPNKEIPNYIKNGKAGHWEYATPKLKPILDSTNGIIIFQEQVMQIFRDLAGYSLGQSDLIRRAMSKKKEYVIKQERQYFIYGNKEKNIVGCVNNGVSEEAANQIYDAMVDFAKYAFNKSHSAAYGVLAYQCAYLKEYYTKEYLCSILNWTDAIDDFAEIISDAKDFGVEVTPPDINYSEEKFDVVNDKIVFGLGNIKGIGSIAATNIINVRKKDGKFTDFKDFLFRTRADKKTITNLVKAGAFDSLGYNRTQLDIDMPYIKELLDILSEINKKERFIEVARAVQSFADEYNDIELFKERMTKEKISGFIVTSKTVPSKESIEKRINNAKNKIVEMLEDFNDIEIEACEEDNTVKLEQEKMVLGLFLTGHPIDDYFVPTNDIADTIVDETIEISGIIQDLEIKKTKSSNQEFATFKLSDKSANINCIIFSSAYDRAKSLIKENNAVYLKGRTNRDEFNSTEDEEILQFVVSEVSTLRKKSNSYRYITNSISAWVDKDYKMLLQCKDENGSQLEVLDGSTGLVYIADFLVNDSILSLGATKYAS